METASTSLVAASVSTQDTTPGAVSDGKAASINSSEENLNRPSEGYQDEQKNEIPTPPPIALCILCQQTRVQVVLLPCAHCVLCTQCFETIPSRRSSSGRRQQVCPVCRTPIESISKATPARYIHPRIYDASLFT
jgi:hypothetical protein